MNTQLVDSLVQVILALPPEERALLGEKLSTASHTPVFTNSSWTEEVVDIFLTLGREAILGRLNNTAVGQTLLEMQQQLWPR